MTKDQKKALSRAMRLCSKQEKCISDIRSKLEEWGQDGESATEIIDCLIKEKFIDENRFASSFVRDKFRLNKWGRLKIRFALKEKGVPQTIADKAISEIEEIDYLEIIEAEIRKKKRSIGKAASFEVKAKLLRFAQSRGYETEVVYDLLDTILPIRRT